MSDILRIIEKHQNQNGSYVNQPDLAQDIQYIQDMMTDAPEADKNAAKEFLKSVMADVEKEIDTLKNELIRKGDTFEKFQKIADACIAYSKPTGRKG